MSDILHTASGWLGGAVLFSSVTILQTGLYVCFYEFVCDGVCSLCSILFDQGWYQITMYPLEESMGSKDRDCPCVTSFFFGICACVGER